MEAMKKREETEEPGMDLRGRLPRQHSNTNSTTIITGSGAFVFSSESEASSEAESLNQDEPAEEESKGSPKNGTFLSDKNGATESPCEISGFNGGNGDFVTSKENPRDEIEDDVKVETPIFQKSAVTNPHDEGDVKVEKLPDFGSLPSKQSIEKNGHDASVNNGITEQGRVKLREISEQEASELYLERVYEKPASCEFYCPNCKSCITKVIIRGREAETTRPASPPPPPVEPFQCTSCFSFLIPVGNWFFPKLVPKDEEFHAEQDAGVSGPYGSLINEHSQTASVSNSSVPNESVGATVAAVAKPTMPAQSVGVGFTVPSHNLSETLHAQKPKVPAQSIGVEVPVPSQDSSGTLYGQKPAVTTQSVGVSFSVPTHDFSDTSYGQKPKIPSQPVGVTEVESKDQVPVLAEPVEASGGIAAITKPSEIYSESIVGVPSQDLNGTLIYQKPSVPGQSVDIHVHVTTEPPASKVDVVADSQDVPQQIADNAGPEEPVLPDYTTVLIPPEPPVRPEPGDTKTFEIVKSIVYGGLAEVITSLGIVTSAASADTATLNIFALAMANLVGGLFIIGHNLWELKDEQVERYQKALGRKENFLLHASVAIVSFIIFGLVPPLVYGFSFRESNNSDLKIAAVAAASLLCIIILAVGKAYIQRPQKYIKTVLYYITIGIGVGGVSYLAGDLIDKLIEKLGWFSSTVSSGTLPLPLMGIAKPALAAY